MCKLLFVLELRRAEDHPIVILRENFQQKDETLGGLCSSKYQLSLTELTYLELTQTSGKLAYQKPC